MQIDCSKLLEKESSFEVKEPFEIPVDYLKNSEILSLSNLNCHVVGTLEGEMIHLQGEVTGVMTLADSISLEEIEYPFTAEIDENLEENFKNNTNLLDITEILWQNIILEVPLKLSHVENFNEYQGDGWKLVSEDSFQNTENPFRELKAMMREE